MGTTLLNNSKQLTRLIWGALAALVAVTLVFGGYYYWDRYVRLDDQSPLELGVADLEEAVRENPQDPDIRLALAQYYYQSGAYTESAQQSQQILDSYPEYDSASFLIGMSHLQMGNLEEAIPALEEFAAVRRQAPMAKTDTSLETALYFLGESYNARKQYDLAIPVLNEALEINYTDADAMYELGTAYTQTGQHEDAITQYYNATRFVPDFTEAYSGMIASYAALDQPYHVAYARGMEAYSLQDYSTAQTHLQSAADNLPEFMPAYLGLGLSYEKLGQLDAASTALLQAAELEPDNFLVEHSLGRVQMSLSDSN